MLSRRPEEIPEDGVAKILARAAELDRRPAVISFDTIRAAALEAGISQAAVDQALAEYATIPKQLDEVAATADAPRAPGRLRRLLRRLARPIQLSALALALGLVIGMGDLMIPLAIGIWIGVALRYLLQVGRAGKTGRWQLTLTLMTFFMGFGHALVGNDEDVLAAILLTGVGLFAAGTAWIHWSSRDDALLDEHAPTT